MSSFMDKAMMAMRLEDDDEPYDLPNLPEFCSSEKNQMSLVGRLLNTDCQKISDLILDMPRKWQLYDKVRGVALSAERFQFIFKYEHDLKEVLSRGVQTYNLWALAMEKWVEAPPPDYLQFIEVWVQIRNISVNHYTVDAITALGEFAGQVVEVAYNPLKAQTKEYVRVKVRFDVSKVLRRSKIVNLPNGGKVTILYDYERIQKRCYTCQRLIHEQDRCPIFLKLREDSKRNGKDDKAQRTKEMGSVLKENDPLIGVLNEKQVGLDPLTGKPRIAVDVLEGLRQYLLVAQGPERIAREEMVKKSIGDLENDPMGQKTMLRLEPQHVVSMDLDKGKGIVYDFKEKDKEGSKDKSQQEGIKMMDSTIRSGGRFFFSGLFDGFYCWYSSTQFLRNKPEK